MEIWFTEGLALLQEFEQYGTEWGKGMEFDDKYTIEELRGDFMELYDIKAYRGSFESVKGIYDDYGKEKILGLFNELRKGYDMRSAFFNIYGETLQNRK